ncbi:choline O-acetyltransferase-like isoform X1 [Centruroides sculpturatus]|uniref:choline O-acetyltransferase-like isoform X1 n=2 Tax=Centruroides sculpturatus TaxID=218467 RepID=UPI000C6E41E5|nr:choline O-acetyltransferase-like isoform X1 [Centruroides sculpturatus]
MEYNENNLPKPPVPELSITMQRFLQGMKAVVNDDQYLQAEKSVKEFEKPGGEGERLQLYLKEYAENDDNYVTSIWLEEKYLKNPLPLPVYSSPFFLLPRREFRKEDDRFNYIAKFIIFSLMFKQNVESGEVMRDLSTGLVKGHHLSMAPYQRLFSVYRRPGEDIDEQIFNKTSRHIVVACNNQFFTLMLPDLSSVPSENALAEKLKDIEKESMLRFNYKWIGILTADNRRAWAKTREILMKNETNKKSLGIIETCLFVICMDDSVKMAKNEMESKTFSDVRLEKMAHHILHGNRIGHSSANRWFDHFIQFIVTKNGINGICMENSVSEGIAVLRFCGEFLHFLSHEFPQRKSDDQLKFERIEWELDSCESIKESIKKTSAMVDLMFEGTDLYIMKFAEFGKEFIKKQNINTDIFIQLSMQLAYYRMYQKLASSFASGGLRKFRYGRVSNIRSCSEEVLEFAKHLFDSSVNWGTKFQKFRKAVDKQTEIFTYTLNGEGPDNHLMCLKRIAALKGLPVPILFEEDFYKNFMNYRLRVYRFHNNYDIICGYGPVVADGYCCTYNHEKNCLTFCISSYKNKSTNSENFAKSLRLSLLEMKALCDHSKNETLPNKLTRSEVETGA